MADFDRVNATSPNLDRAQKRIQEGLGRGNPPMQDGAEISFSVTSPNPVTVPHKLGRKPRGWQVTGRESGSPAVLTMVEMGSKLITFLEQWQTSTPATYPVTKYKVWVF